MFGLLNKTAAIARFSLLQAGGKDIKYHQFSPQQGQMRAIFLQVPDPTCGKHVFLQVPDPTCGKHVFLQVPDPTCGSASCSVVIELFSNTAAMQSSSSSCKMLALVTYRSFQALITPLSSEHYGPCIMSVIKTLANTERRWWRMDYS
jgi:hypothetical protein